MAVADYFETVQKIYIAFYQRPADPAGLRYWADRVDVAGGDTAAVIDAFANSEEATALYGDITEENIGETITKIYQALFGRAPDAAGLAYYEEAFANGELSAGTIALQILDGASGEDTIAINNKLEVANEFTQQVDGREFDDANFGRGSNFAVTYDAEDVEAARAILVAVTAAPGTVLDANAVRAALQEQIANEGDDILTANPTFTLTSAIGENIQGTAGDDVISAVLTATGDGTLNVGDQINGAAGFDTLNLVADTGTLPTGASISGVERVNLNLSTGVTVKAADFGSDLEQLWLRGAANNTVTLANGVTLGLGNMGAIGATQVSSTGANFSLALNGLANSQTITVDDASLRTIDVSGSVAKDVDVVLVNANATTLNLAMTSDADIEAQQLTALKTIDGSASTGNLQLDLAGLDKLESVTGGSGDDYIIFSGNLDASVEVDGGEGEDTVQINSGGTISAGERLAINALKNVEALFINDDVTIDVSKITSVDKFGFGDSAIVTGISDDSQIVGGAGETMQELVLSHADSTASGAAGTVHVTSLSYLNVSAGSTGFESIVVDGQGFFALDNTQAYLDDGEGGSYTAIDAKQAATSIDLSALGLDADNDGEIDTDFITAALVLNGDVAEEVTLSKGIDVVDVSSSTFGNLDVITGFTVTGDYADYLNILDGEGAVALTKLELSESTDTIAKAFLEAAASDEVFVYFHFEGNTYIFGDTVSEDDVESGLNDGDFALQLTGVLNLDEANLNYSFIDN